MRTSSIIITHAHCLIITHQMTRLTIRLIIEMKQMSCFLRNLETFHRAYTTRFALFSYHKTPRQVIMRPAAFALARVDAAHLGPDAPHTLSLLRPTTRSVKAQGNTRTQITIKDQYFVVPCPFGTGCCRVGLKRHRGNLEVRTCQA